VVPQLRSPFCSGTSIRTLCFVAAHQFIAVAPLVCASPSPSQWHIKLAVAFSVLLHCTPRVPMPIGNGVPFHSLAASTSKASMPLTTVVLTVLYSHMCDITAVLMWQLCLCSKSLPCARLLHFFRQCYCIFCVGESESAPQWQDGMMKVCGYFDGGSTF
jgi:hypothetical protein